MLLIFFDNYTKKVKPANIHAHIMLTMRSIDNEGFGLKVREWNSKAKLKYWREYLGDLTNLYLERTGLELRVNHKGRAVLEMEQGKHFDYSIQYESIDITPVSLMEQSYQLEEPLPNELLLESGIEKVCHSDSDAKVERENRVRSLPYELDDPTTSGERAFDLHDNASEFHQFQQELKSLVILGNGIELTDDQQLIQLEHLAQQLDGRLQKIEATIKNHTDPVFRERLQLQVEIERSFFLEHSSKLRASILAKKERILHVDSMLAYRRQATLSGKAYKSYAYEWCRRSVRDPSYFTIDQKLSKTIDRIRARETDRWAAFNERALKFNWDKPRRAQEAKILQQRLDNELAINLERSLGLNLGLELRR